MSEPRTARTRLRFVLGMPTRKTDFQICELTMPSFTALRFAIDLPACEILRRFAPQDFRDALRAPLKPSETNPDSSTRPVPDETARTCRQRSARQPCRRRFWRAREGAVPDLRSSLQSDSSRCHDTDT